MLREEIADTLKQHIKSYDLAQVCVALGLDLQREDEDPHHSKAAYVRHRLHTRGMPELVDIARQIVDEFGGDELAKLVGRLGVRGVSGDLKNLIFSADGPKPEIVLTDALNNVIRITKNEQYCLVYNRPLTERGLTWRELVTWWTDREKLTEGMERKNAISLYERLLRSMRHNGVEADFFKGYASLYGKYDYDIPALIPQVYMHYDPYTRKQLGRREGALARQRMDFLLLMPGGVRVVVEIDGRHHYSDEHGEADAGRYASMVAEDRKLRLARYEVYRFGVAELKEKGVREVSEGFFQELLTIHGHIPASGR